MYTNRCSDKHTERHEQTQAGRYVTATALKQFNKIVHVVNIGNWHKRRSNS